MSSQELTYKHTRTIETRTIAYIHDSLYTLYIYIYTSSYLYVSICLFVLFELRPEILHNLFYVARQIAQRAILKPRTK